MKDFFKIWWISLLFKFVLSAFIPLSADEAYYWVWSQRLQLSYFDHPPMVAWLFYLGSFLENFLNAVRWPAVLLGHCTLIVWYEILKDSFPWEKIRIWIYLALFSPLIGFGSLIITPDLPVILFWSLGILFALKALEEKALKYYLALGISLGLGFCAKYHIVLFVPCLLAYLTFDRRWKDVRLNGIFITLASGLLLCTPVLAWNYLNDFASFKFQIAHGLEKSSYKFSWTSSYLLGQILVLSPLVFWAALRSKAPKNLSALYYFAWGPLLFFFLTSFRALVEANWPIIAYPAVFALALSFDRIQKWTRYYVIFWAGIFTIVISTVFIPQLRNLNEKVAEPFDFQELAAATKDLRPLYASSYQMASSLWFFSKTPVFKLKDISRFDFFDTLPEATPGGDHFYLVKRNRNDFPSWLSEEQWQQSEVLKIEPDFVVYEFRKK